MLLNELFYLSGRILNEDAALLSKGSRNVLANKNLVATIADVLRDDARMHPGEFGGKAKELAKATDENLVIWFLAQLDRMEKEGYEGIVYSRDGVNNLWIAQRYAAYNDTWEDITGKLQPAMSDFYLLKNRNMLEPKHAELNSYRGVRDLGAYMTTHYGNQLEELRRVAKANAQNKNKKAIKLIDNEDYQVFIPLNRTAACVLGGGSRWCTAMSHTDAHYHSYSNQAMLYVLLPKNAKVTKVQKDGKVFDSAEKFQFGPDSYMSFKDITDAQVNKREMVSRFPYLYTDIATQLAAKKGEIENLLDTLEDDPKLQSKDLKIKKYNVDDEIQKLHKFVDQGYMTDEVRPPAEPAAPELAAPEQPAA